MKFVLLVFVQVFVAMAAFGSAWDDKNNPTGLGRLSTSRFSALPRSGAANLQPWTGNAWHSRGGGIASRWQTGERAWDYNIITRPLELSLLQTKTLSPAEKYDLLTGQYNFPTVLGERNRNNPNDVSWAGLCHGWASASIVFKEPRPVVLKNKDGLRIDFGSADVKAILIPITFSS